VLVDWDEMSVIRLPFRADGELTFGRLTGGDMSCVIDRHMGRICGHAQSVKDLCGWLIIAYMKKRCLRLSYEL
jgi:hypothetical protein